MTDSAPPVYRGRLAPTPSGYLHLGHASTFWTAFQRARERNGVLLFRNEDLDPDRCRPEFAVAAIEDLRWLGIDWQEGPDVGGPHAPYTQSQRLDHFRRTWFQLHAAGAIYPSPHSRKDVQDALVAPHDDRSYKSELTGAMATAASGHAPAQRDSPDGEPVFPVQLRPPQGAGEDAREPGEVNWRFRVPDGEIIAFIDLRIGRVERTAGRDFGDFVVWRKDSFPSYELAVVGDDHAMEITEVVRGDDLLTSTCRQLLIYRALGWKPPAFYHCPLVIDAGGNRLAKRNDALSLRMLRKRGSTAEQIRAHLLIEP
ncbi:MAG TPA: glutamate--tRNA ligase family protein [Pirellulales bacterium]|jgi:glutamyl-tRNA synthetase|nr:glutamate--tRNA ligase family protein [Pirellulales bacterium]